MVLVGRAAGGEGGGGGVKSWTFALGRITKNEQVWTRGEEGSKFWSICENVIIECANDWFRLFIIDFV